MRQREPGGAAPDRLTVSASSVDGVRLLRAVGTLNSRTYLYLRDYVINAALTEPLAVLVDVKGLKVPAPSAWAVFSSARWHVSVWPNVPIVLVCGPTEMASQIAETGVTRHVPSHSTVEGAIRSLRHRQRRRRRSCTELTRGTGSLPRARDFVAQRLSDWSQNQLIPIAQVIVDALVENVLRHTQSAPTVLLECDGSTITIAVHDDDATPAMLHEATDGAPRRPSGLAVIGALSRAWGTAPEPNGKTVWATLGSESHL